MTVANTDGRSTVQLTNGVERVWTYDFLVYDQSHIALEIRTVADGALVEEVTSGFFVGGVGRVEGGSVTYPQGDDPALPAGYSVTVARRVPYGQTYQFSNQGGLYPQDIEKALDLLAMQVIQLKDRLDGTDS